MLKVIDDGEALSAPLYTVEMAVRWADLDADGVVNNTVVLRFAEEARIKWAASLSLEQSDSTLAPMVASVGCNYHAPIGYPAALRVQIRCGKVGSSSLGLVAEIFDARADTLYAQVGLAWVWVDKMTRRPLPMPQALRRACVAHR